MTQTETSLVLLISHEEWAGRSFESILKPNGYAVLKAYTGRQGLELVGQVRPDIVMVEHRLPDMAGCDVTTRLRDLSTIRPSTPILAFTTGSLERRDRLTHLRSGAWDVLSPPFDPDEVLARVDRYVAAKRDTDSAVADSQVDPHTGFYNLQGLVRRVTELAADSTRSGRELSCIMMGPALEPESGEEADAPPAVEELPPVPPEVAEALARVMSGTTRLSDSIGRISDNDFVIVAPGVGEPGARRLAERVIGALQQSGGGPEGMAKIRLKAGIYATDSSRYARMSPEEFLWQAQTALREAQRERNGLTIHSLDAGN